MWGCGWVPTGHELEPAWHLRVERGVVVFSARASYILSIEDFGDYWATKRSLALVEQAGFAP
jgi:hypothetical protein